LLLVTATWATAVAAFGTPAPALFGVLMALGFLGGLRWRAIADSQRGGAQEKPLTWSGASTGAFVGLGLAFALTRTVPSGWVVATFLISLEALYGVGKWTCLRVGCCDAPRSRSPVRLPMLELVAAASLILVGGALVVRFPLAAVTVIAHGQYVLRILSRWARSRLLMREVALETTQVAVIDACFVFESVIGRA
jgi:hypothetical protein